MKVYYNGSAKEMSVMLCPGAHLPKADCPAEWFEEDGTTPRQFGIKFTNGEAIVEPPLGRYLCAQKIARSTKILMPGQAHRPSLVAA